MRKEGKNNKQGEVIFGRWDWRAIGLWREWKLGVTEKREGQWKILKYKS